MGMTLLKILSVLLLLFSGDQYLQAQSGKADPMRQWEQQHEQIDQQYRKRLSEVTNRLLQATHTGKRDERLIKALEQEKRQVNDAWRQAVKQHEARKPAVAKKTQPPATVPSPTKVTPVDGQRHGQAAAPAPPAFKPGASKPPAGFYLTPGQVKAKEEYVKANYFGTPQYIYNDGKVVDVVPEKQNDNLLFYPGTRTPVKENGRDVYATPKGYHIVQDMNTGKVVFKKDSAQGGGQPQISISPGVKPAATCDAVPGRWRWFINGDAEFTADKQVRQKQVNARGEWSCTGHTLKIHWTLVDGRQFWDVLEISANGQKLRGFGSDKPNPSSGWSVTADRIR